MSDAKPPYFPLYVLDFCGSGRVEAMTTQAVGSYILLLCKAWHQVPPCSLPDDDQTLARWSRLGADDWSSVKACVVACWERRADGRLYQPRLEREWRKMIEAQRRKEKAGKLGAAKRWQTHSSAIATALPPQCHSESDSESDGGFAKPHPPPANPVAEDGAVFIALCDCGFTTGRAYRLAGHPNATPERVKGLIDEATKAGTKLKDPLAFIVAGIRDAWVPSSPDDFKPSTPRETPKERAARIVAKMNGATT